MVDGGAALCHKFCHVVLVRQAISMPCGNIERAVILDQAEIVTVDLLNDVPLLLQAVRIVDMSYRVCKVSSIRIAITTNWTQVRQLESRSPASSTYPRASVVPSAGLRQNLIPRGITQISPG